MTDLKELERLALAATKGEWKLGPNGRNVRCHTVVSHNGSDFNIERLVAHTTIHDKRDADMKWIVASQPATISALIAELTDARALLASQPAAPQEAKPVADGEDWQAEHKAALNYIGMPDRVIDSLVVYGMTQIEFARAVEFEVLARCSAATPQEQAPSISEPMRTLIVEGQELDGDGEASAPAGAVELPPLPKPSKEMRAYWKCDSCDGRGHDGELHSQGYFQPPEPAQCHDCKGSGMTQVDAYLPWETEAYGQACARMAGSGKQEPVAVDGFVLVPLIPNREMVSVMSDDDWTWEDLLAAAEAITEEQYDRIVATPAAPSSEADAKDAEIVPGYRVTAKGDVIDRDGKTLMAYPRGGYLCVSIWRGGVRSEESIHRLVAEAFCSKHSPEQTQVNHRDGDKHNNAADNLEWCSPQENSIHGARVIFSLNKRAVIGTSLADGSEITFQSLAEAEEHGFKRANIQKVIDGKRKSHGGFIWRDAALAAQKGMV